MTRPAPAQRSNTANAVVQPTEPVRLDIYRLATLIGIASLVVGSVGFGADAGVTSICVSAVLLLLTPKSHTKVIESLPWSALVLVCGMLTYMAVLKQNGTLDLLGDATAALGSPLLAALILCFSVGLLSAFGSSIGTLGIALPLATPLLMSGDVGALGFVAALAFCATAVDVSPFGTSSLLVLANAPADVRPRFQRKMLAYCGLVVLIAPLIVWAAVIVPTTVF
jgi:di/tricarboxylate transporter